MGTGGSTAIPPPDEGAVRRMAAFDELVRMDERFYDVLNNSDYAADAILAFLRYKEWYIVDVVIDDLRVKAGRPLTRRPRRGRV